MSAMAVCVSIPPDLWFQVAGVWVHVTPVDDPLLRANLHRVTVHRDETTGAVLAVHVAGNCAEFRWHLHQPDTHDFASTDGEPL